MNVEIWRAEPYCRSVDGSSLEQFRRKILPKVPLMQAPLPASPSACTDILRSSPIWVSASLPSAEHRGCSTVPALKRFLTMEFYFQFLDVWGSLERMKRNFDLCDFNRCFQLYFLAIFWEETQFIENTNAMRGEPFQDLPGMLKVQYISRDTWEGKGWLYLSPLMQSNPFQFLINHSQARQACRCKSKQNWWKRWCSP